MFTKIYNSITEIDENQWNSIVGRNRIICTYQFLLAIEKSNINDCKYYYPVVYENNKIVAHACVYSITTDLDTLATGIAKKIILFVRLIWKNFLKIKFLECGTPIAIGNTISFIEKINKAKVLNLLVDCIESIAREKKIGMILFRDFYENEIPFYNNLNQRRYKKIKNLPNTIVDVKWNSFSEYRRNMRSHYRYRLNKNINKIKENNINVEVCDEFFSVAEDLQLLWKNVYDRAKEIKREILTKEFFININTHLRKNTKTILFKKDNQIIGLALLLIDDDTLKFMFSGIDYNYNEKYSIYYNSLYYIIKQAIIEKKKEIDLGLTTYYPKTDVGAKMVNVFMYIKHTNLLLNPIITNLLNIMNPKVRIFTKNVFIEKIENKFVKIIK
jgi:predicted N-acyltransferase